MSNFISLTHITDVGASSGDGVDSMLRIRKQYERLGVFSPSIIPAGHSPLHVAFAACTDVSRKARQNTNEILKFLSEQQTNVPVALNSAPRNSKISQHDGKEDYIYRIKFANGKPTYLMYGPDVKKWVLLFNERKNLSVERVVSINDIIPDTSCGSQFRSAEHLPIAHVLEAHGLLDKYAKIEKVDLDTIENIFTEREKSIVVAPPDEYGNGRLIADEELVKKILAKGKIAIAGITDYTLAVKDSLTNVVPDELSIWPSSNFFTDCSLAVLNIGTRWKPETTRTTNVEVIELSKRLALSVGKIYEVGF